MLERSVEQAQLNLLALGQQLLQQQRQLAALDQRLTQVTEQRQAAGLRLRADRLTLGTIVRRLYKHQDSFFAALLRSGGFGPLLQVIGYSDVLVEHEQTAIRVVQADQVALQHSEALLSRSRDQQQALVEQLTQTHLALSTQLGQEQDLQTRLQAAIAGALQALGAAQTDSPAIAQARARLIQLQTDALLRQIEQTVGAQDILLKLSDLVPDDPALRETGRLLWPIPNATITQGFGPTAFTFEAAYAGFAHFHTGLDLAVPLGTPVFAAADGLVVEAQAMTDGSGNLVGYGNYIIIQHATGLETLYGHLLTILVKPGQVVQRGQLIGLVGSTGNSTGPHTHFEVRIDNTPVDPTQLLPQSGPGVPAQIAAEGATAGQSLP
jgi:murein DD-endopeptidase MepM/ murein hydrolase activator NlpD